MRFVRGRVLDLGCGAGRVSLHLQRRTREVVGIDVSPLAIQNARSRGVADARVGTLERFIDSGAGYVAVIDLAASS